MNVDLVALPFAGSHMDPFLHLRRQSEEAFGLTSATLTYPGHGKRIAQKPLASIPAMAADALDQVLARQAQTGPKDIVLMGYSMGSLVSYELYFLLRANGIHVPAVLFMASTPPPKVKGTDLEIESDEELLEHCVQYGLISPADFPSTQLRSLFLPALRRDIQAVDRYPGAERGTRVLDAETTVCVFSGRQDATVAHSAYWSAIAAREPAAYDFYGGHFFLNECRDEVGAAVLAALSLSLERTPA